VEKMSEIVRTQINKLLYNLISSVELGIPIIWQQIIINSHFQFIFNNYFLFLLLPFHILLQLISIFFTLYLPLSLSLSSLSVSLSLSLSLSRSLALFSIFQPHLILAVIKLAKLLTTSL